MTFVPATSDSRPIFVLCSGRSGSTLLRKLLDATSTVACPPEGNLLAVCQAAEFAASSVLGHTEQSEVALDRICVTAAAATFGVYAQQHGKTRWCDKSLYSVEDTRLLARAYADAQFICLYRDPLDTTASILEASAWGFNAYGVDPYVRAMPGNTVAATLTLWADRTDALIDAETHLRSRAHRLRYEDLVADPRGTFGRLCRWLDVPVAARDLNDVLSDGAESTPSIGDYKIRQTDAIHNRSVGRGWTLPTHAIPPPLASRVDHLAGTLGYHPVHDLARVIGGHSGPEPESVTEAIALIASRLDVAGDGAGTFDLVVRDVPCVCRVDLAHGLCTSASEPTTGALVVTERRWLEAVANGSHDPAVAMRHGLIRPLLSEADDPRGLVEALERFVAGLRRNKGRPSRASASQLTH